jgi:Bifunctional DNA primase/polymerase, N-terminal
MIVAIEPTSSLQQAALARAEEGWWVHPLYGIVNRQCTCAAGGSCAWLGKHPRLTGWQQEATHDPETISRWWRRRSHANIGGMVDTGQIVLDIDPRNGGEVTLELLTAEYGTLPDTVTVLTAGGGKHLYFRGNLVGHHDIGSGVELLGVGCNVVLPGSVGVNGRMYEYEASSGPEDLTVAPAPAWLFVLATSTRQEARTTTRPAPRIPPIIPDDYRANTVPHGAIYVGDDGGPIPPPCV